MSVSVVTADGLKRNRFPISGRYKQLFLLHTVQAWLWCLSGLLISCYRRLWLIAFPLVPQRGISGAKPTISHSSSFYGT